MTVFISYSHKDHEFADKLATTLFQAKVPVFLDKWELNIGDSLIQKVQDAISSADILVVVLSKNSVQSEWCKKELNAGLMRELDEKKVLILPALVEDCEIPLFLREKMYADFRTSFGGAFKKLYDSIIAKISTDQIRIDDNGEYLTDWGVDWCIKNDLLIIRVDSVSFSKKFAYSLLCYSKIICNKEATRRFRIYAEKGIEWIYKDIIMSICNELMTSQDTRIRITDNFYKNLQIEVKDFKDEGIGFEIDVNCKRLGNDNGFDLIFDFGTIFQMYCQHIKKQQNEMNDLTRQKAIECFRESRKPF